MVKDSYQGIYNTQSVYCYPGTNVLINKAGIMDSESLERVDSMQTTYILSKLHLSNIRGTFDIGHYKAIHKTLLPLIE